MIIEGQDVDVQNYNPDSLLGESDTDADDDDEDTEIHKSRPFADHFEAKFHSVRC